MKKTFYLFCTAILLSTSLKAAVDDPGYMFKDGNWTYFIVFNTEYVKQVMLTCCEETGPEINVPETATHPTTGKKFNVVYIATNRRTISQETAGPLTANNDEKAKEAKNNIDKLDTNNSPFAGNKELQVLNIPKTVRYIDRGYIYKAPNSMPEVKPSWCNILTGVKNPVQVNIAADNPYLKTVDDVVYSKDGTTLMLYPTIHTSTSYTVNEGVTTIKFAAFTRRGQNSLDYLTKVVLPSTIKTIESNAFYNNRLLNDINFPEGLTSLGWQAFYDTKSLLNIDLPSTLKIIDCYCFEESGLTSVEVPGGVTTISDYAFARCMNMTSAVLNVGTKNLNEGAFAGDTLLTSITLPEGLLTINKYALSGCRQLPNITLPSTVQTIGNYAFAYNRDMTTINIPRDITTLGKGIFMCCLNLENIPIDEGCTRYQLDNDNGKLDKGVLYGNSDGALNTMDELVFFIPKNNIGDDNKDLIKQWIVPNSVRKICAGSMGEHYIESLILPSELTTIEELAFYRLKGFSFAKDVPKEEAAIKEYYRLRELTIPAKVTNIHTSAFLQVVDKKSSFIKNIYILGTPTITTEDVTIITSVGQRYSYISGSYKRSNDDLSIYVKQSNFNNSKFTNVKETVNNRFYYEIPLDRSSMTETGKVSSFCRDFDMDFSNTTGVSVYVSTEFDASAKAYKMNKVNYVPSRTGTNKDTYHGVIIRMEDPTAVPTYRIGEQDYASSSQKIPTAFNNNKLVGVVANSHVQGTEGEGAEMKTNWGLSNGKWQKIVNRGKLTPYNRAYLQTDATETAVITGKGGQNAKIAMYFLDDVDNETTDIKTVDELTNKEADAFSGWYTIHGMRLNGRPTKKGIYIHNGRKEIIR